jgi:hypothetical protein
MKSKIIIMITNNDKTVKNALEVFEQAKDLPVDFWGFKDVGLPLDEMKKLVSAMKKAGKKTFLEVVTYSEEECISGAKIAVDCGFDYLMGTLYFDSVWNYLKEKSIRFLPFVGEVSGSPSILEGSIENMIKEGKNFEYMGIHGIDLLAYRYVNNPEELAAKLVNSLNLSVVMAGSVDSIDRINKVNEINPWAFTMGSALFNKKFKADGSFRENLQEVIKIMDSIL